MTCLRTALGEIAYTTEGMEREGASSDWLRLGSALRRWTIFLSATPT